MSRKAKVTDAFNRYWRKPVLLEPPSPPPKADAERSNLTEEEMAKLIPDLTPDN